MSVIDVIMVFLVWGIGEGVVYCLDNVKFYYFDSGEDVLGVGIMFFVDIVVE